MITTDELEQTISAIANCKQDTTETSGQEMQSLVRDGLGALLNLHMQYIEQCKTASGASKRVAEQKTSYEKSLLALQNKRVEKLFYERMINANRAFQSQFSDKDVDLLAEHDFHARCSADEATLAAVPDMPHETMKRRLQDEYEQREALQNDKVAIEKQLQELQNENKAKRQKLDSAKSQIEQVAAAAKPAFRNLRLGALDSADTANTAMFPQLPAKLQALYFQIASATAIASVDAQVTIEHARKRKQVVLSMVVKGSKMTIIFVLLQDIDVITARCSDKNQIQYVLEALYPNDAGDSWPSGKQPAQDVHSMARPYRWCQDLVDAPDGSSNQRSSLHKTVEFLQLLQLRCSELRSLWLHLQALKSGKAPDANVEDSAAATVPVTDEAPVIISRWKEVQGVSIAALQQLRKDGPKEEGELDECEKDDSQPQTDLNIRLEGTLDAEGIATFHISLKLSLYYPYVFPDFRITPLEGVQMPRQQLAAIEAETNVTQALEAPHDPLPAQFSYMCSMLHAAVASQATPQPAVAASPTLPGIGKLRVKSDPAE